MKNTLNLIKEEQSQGTIVAVTQRVQLTRLKQTPFTDFYLDLEDVSSLIRMASSVLPSQPQREVKRLQHPKRSPVAIIQAHMVTMATWMTENLHQSFSNPRCK